MNILASPHFWSYAREKPCMKGCPRGPSIYVGLYDWGSDMTYRSGSFRICKHPERAGNLMWMRSTLTALEFAEEDESRSTRPMPCFISLVVYHRSVSDLDKQISQVHATSWFRRICIREEHVKTASCCARVDFPLTLSGSDPTANAQFWRSGPVGPISLWIV